MTHVDVNVRARVRARPGGLSSVKRSVTCGVTCGVTRASWALFVGFLFACSTTPHGEARTGDPNRPELVVSDGARADVQLFRGKATFGVRSAREGKAERVVSIPGLGEIQTSVSGSDTCRLVWSRDGLDSLSIFEGTGCPAPEAGRMCFDRARFKRSGSHEPNVIDVDGCADENDLLWGKLEGSGPRHAEVARPTSFRQRCRKLPKPKKACELTYVKKESVRVDHNDSGDDGFALAYDGERWRACFLEKTSGRYVLTMIVEDSCGARERLVLEGDSSELDD